MFVIGNISVEHYSNICEQIIHGLIFGHQLSNCREYLYDKNFFSNCIWAILQLHLVILGPSRTDNFLELDVLPSTFGLMG